MMIPLLPLLIVIGGVAWLAAMHSGVPSVWTDAEQQRIDRALSDCIRTLRSQGWPTAAVSDPTDPERDLSPVEGLQLCVAQTLYPREQWPPLRGESGSKMIAWTKLGEAAALAIAEAGI